MGDIAVASDPKQTLAQLGITLPAVPVPVANYQPVIATPPVLTLSGQLPLVDGRVTVTGRLGEDVGLEKASQAAEQSVLNLLAVVEQWCAGDWGRVVRCIRLGGFFQVAPTFFDLSKAMNGASDLMVAALGDAGKHARTTVGVATLPMNAVVEIDAVFLVRP